MSRQGRNSGVIPSSDTLPSEHDGYMSDQRVCAPPRRRRRALPLREPACHGLWPAAEPATTSRRASQTGRRDFSVRLLNSAAAGGGLVVDNSPDIPRPFHPASVKESWPPSAADTRLDEHHRPRPHRAALELVKQRRGRSWANSAHPEEPGLPGGVAFSRCQLWVAFQDLASLIAQGTALTTAAALAVPTAAAATAHRMTRARRWYAGRECTIYWARSRRRS